MEAEKLQLEMTETSKKELGRENLATLVTMNNLAFTYMNQSRWNEAEELQLIVTGIQKGHRGIQKGTRPKTSTYFVHHGQPCKHIQEPRALV
jgi:hypothetical protein